MELKVIIEDLEITLNLSEDFINHTETFFRKMDADMDQGIQLGRNWIEQPDLEDRIKLVSNKLVSAIENHKDHLGRMMAGYILSRAPTVGIIDIDTSGDISATEIGYRNQNTHQLTDSQMPDDDLDLYGGIDPELQKKAEQHISTVFQIDAGWCYSIQDGSGKKTKITLKTEHEAKAAREQSIKDFIKGQIA